MNSVLALLILICILVFFHELGHFLVAKWCKVGVETFSIGFGPKIFKKKYGETIYCISAIPLGGYVKMVGEEQGATVSPEEISRSFTHKKLYQKSLIVAAGPVFNFLLSILVLYIVFQISGASYLKPVIGEVTENSPAYKAGIQSGDIVKEVNSKKIKAWSDFSLLVDASKGEKLEILFERSNEKKIAVSIKPELTNYKTIFKEDKKRYVIGVRASGENVHESLNPIQAFKYSLDINWYIVKMTVISIGKMINGDISFKENVGGPIKIAQAAGKAAKQGVTDFVFLLAGLSISLGIINLFPIPVLDGGHLMFFAIEAVTGKQTSEKIREKANQVGIFVLVLLMIFVFYNDIVQLIKGG
ncbi:MAG: RIP metalloprotease RseP [Desulfobacteraceae bacterium]|nr:RIP metalloprotease RseP [Desulfobacteraceae bacterium]